MIGILSIFLKKDHWLFSKSCLVVLMFLVGIILILSTFRNPFIGHADEANCAVVAKNLCEGKGYYVNYIFQFFVPTPIKHPEEIWPILHPTVVALFFKIGGYNVTMARLPNIIYILLTSLITYIFARKLTSDNRAAFISAILVLFTHRYQTGLLNNTGATFFFLLFIMFVWLHETKKAWKWLFFASLFAGLAALQRTEYILLYPLYIIFKFLIFVKMVKIPKIVFKNIIPYLLLGCLTFIVISPYFIKNIYYFGSLFPKNAGYQQLLSKYASFCHDAQYGIYYGHPLTIVSIAFSGGWFHFLQTNFRNWMWVMSGFFSQIGGFILTAFCMIGILWESKIFKRNMIFHLYVIFIFIFYALFFGFVYHYEDRYFFFIFPYVAILGVAVIFEGLDRIEKLTPVNYFLKTLPVIILIFWCMYHFSSICWTHFRGIEKGYKEIIEVGKWISENSPPDSIVMSRIPWEMSWHSDRDGIIFPDSGIEGIINIAKKYRVNYFVYNTDSYARPQLLNAIMSKRLQGVTSVYRSGSHVVYKIIDVDRLYLSEYR
jgi:4-amino-4-deoxy-L-arabinose transferase-like glycosyltransferase